ncbi:MAG TPA: hypothetical protein VNN15_06630 [Solirubrobacterales bacterium]|nr:hypothetical protein [Solirubrobacterales bacterium]
MPEILLILEGDPQDPALEEVRQGQRVTQALSDRVFAIEEPNPQRVAELEEMPGVLLCAKGSEPSRIPPELTEEERLWIDAWGLRTEQKQRPGEGLSWDAPGFEPPDPPPERG